MKNNKINYLNSKKEILIQTIRTAKEAIKENEVLINANINKQNNKWWMEARQKWIWEYDEELRMIDAIIKDIEKMDQLQKEIEELENDKQKNN